MNLPTIPQLRRITKSIATLDLILEPEWQYRYYSYNANWSADEEMASMRDGSGDEWFLLFHASGWAALKGFAHESPAAGVPGLSDALHRAVPDVYTVFAQEPAFRWDSTTFCLWCEGPDSAWEHPHAMHGLDTGVDDLLGILGSGPEGYRAFVQEYYEREVPLSVVENVFNHQKIDDAMVKTLNPDVALGDVRGEIAKIGYPL